MVTTPGVYKFDNTDYEISAKIVIKKNFIFYFSLYFNFKQIRDQDFNWISKLADDSFGSEVPTSFCRSLHYNYNQTSWAKISYLLIAFWLPNTECMLYQGTAMYLPIALFINRKSCLTCKTKMKTSSSTTSHVPPTALVHQPLLECFSTY